MKHHQTILATIAFAFLASACGKAESHAEEVETTSDPQIEFTEAQEDESAAAGLTKQQYDQMIALSVASGMTKEQAEAMLAMANGAMPAMGASGMPIALEEIAAMDPRAKEEAARDEARSASIQKSGVTVQYDGVDYVMQYAETPQCADFFGFSSTGFLARTKPDAERGPTLSFGSGFTVNFGTPAYNFTFWKDFNPENRFDPKYATVHITLLDENGHTTGYEGHADSGAALNLANSKGLIIEKSRLFYEGPVAADSDKIITIEAIYCPG